MSNVLCWLGEQKPRIPQKSANQNTICEIQGTLIQAGLHSRRDLHGSRENPVTSFTAKGLDRSNAAEVILGSRRAFHRRCTTQVDSKSNLKSHLRCLNPADVLCLRARPVYTFKEQEEEISQLKAKHDMAI